MSGVGSESAPLSDGASFGALRPGSRLRTYEIVSVLGQGSFGITYLARDLQLDREVAIKEYLPSVLAVRADDSNVRPRSTELAGDFVWGRDRFLEEARTLAKLGHAPSIVRVHDFLESNGTAYMVMPLVKGETLEHRIKRNVPLSASTIERLLYPLLDGLEQVHEAGFLHRDIKPANIILDANDSPTLIDFGASRAAMLGRTVTMTAILTPSYAAAEQFSSAKQGPWTDIYGLAATLYHAIAGYKPPSVMERVLDDSYVSLTQVPLASFPRSLLAGIDAGLKVRPADRPQSVRDWRAGLTSGAAPTDDTVVSSAKGPDSATPPPSSVPVKTAPPSARTKPAESVLLTANGHRTRLLIGGAVAVLLVLVVGYFVFASNRPGSVDTAAQSLTAAQLEQALAERRKADAAAAEKKRLEEEAQRQADADAKAKQAADAELAKAQDERQKAEDELAKLRADIAARRRTEATQREQAEAAARRALEEAARRNKAESETAALRRAEEDARQTAAAAAAAKQQADEAAQRNAEPEAAARREAEDVARRKAEAEAETKRQADEALAKAQAARQQADQEAARQKAELEARQKADSESKAKAEAEARQRDEAAAKQKAEAELKAKADAEAAADKKAAEAVEAALRLAVADRQRLQVALTSLGFDTRGSDGVFGPRSREMIAAWQRARSQPPTGFLNTAQQQALMRDAAPAIAKYDDEQKKAEEEKRKTEEAKKKAEEEAKSKAAEATATSTSTVPPAVAAAPPQTTESRDGLWSGALECRMAGRQPIEGTIANGNGRLTGGTVTISVSVIGTAATAKVGNKSPYGQVGTLSGELRGRSISASGLLRRPGSPATDDCSVSLVGP